MLKKILVSLMIPLLCACAWILPVKPTDTPLSPPTSAPSEPSMEAPSQSDENNSDEQAVYSVFFAENPDVTLLLQDTGADSSMTSPEEVMDFIKSGLPAVSDETINDYLKNNKQDSQLSASMNVGAEYQLLSADEFAEISSQSDWGNVLKEKYPDSNGYMFFSRVGFNNAHDQALIYVGRVYGPLAGEASYYLLEKKDAKWMIVNQILRVIS